MPYTIKEISDALIARIIDQVAEINSNTCRSFPGFGYAEIINFPFVGVAYNGSDDLNYTSDNATCDEIIQFKLSVAGEDFRGASYSMESSYELLGSLRTALQGQQLGLFIEPIQILRTEPDRFMLDLGTTVYNMFIRTQQTQQ